MLNLNSINSTLDNGVQGALSTKLTNAERYTDVMNITTDYFQKVGIGLFESKDYYYVFTGNTGLANDEHKFPTFTQAYAFAFQTYVEKLTGAS